MIAHYAAIEAVANGTWAGPVRAGTPQDTIHRPDCKAIRGSAVLPWNYAVGGLTDAEIGECRAAGLTFCRRCGAAQFVRALLP